MSLAEHWLDRPDGSLPLIVGTPDGPGNGAAVVLAAEAYGINDFTREVAAKLASLGYVVVVPDYYRGQGPTDRDNYQDFSEVMVAIDALDFGRATHDVMASVTYALELPGVDPDRVGVWGYCTGGTLALLTAALDPRLAAAVVFFPSQPTFPELTAKRPVQPVDLLWNIACPIQLLYGDQDFLKDVMPEIERRLNQWGIEHEIKVYAGAGHAFSAPDPPLRHDAADRASWVDATAFASRHLGARPG
jgi:carboxymethylenebutenolidase